jgi:hypothetical protein
MKIPLVLAIATCAALTGSAQAANLVYFQYTVPPGNPVVVGDPAFASGSAFGATGSTDLAAGTFKSLATASGAGSSAGCEVGVNNKGAGFDYFSITNVGPAFAVPSFTVHVSGTYAFGSAPNAIARAQSFAQLIVTLGSLHFGASVNHQTFTQYDAAGAVYTTGSTLQPPLQQGGATTNVFSATVGDLVADLVIPGFVWPAGGVMFVSYTQSATATGGGGSATCDFSHTGTMTMMIPAGAHLTSNAGVALAWITSGATPALTTSWGRIKTLYRRD